MLIKGDPLRQRGLSELKLAQLAADLRLSASQAPEHRGSGVPDRRCVRVLPAAGLVVLFTRDSGMHESGWFKNPHFERCLHLSLSFRDPMTGEAAPWDEYVARRIARAFFDDAVKWIWTESANTEGGRKLGVVHYRVFCDEKRVGRAGATCTAMRRSRRSFTQDESMNADDRDGVRSNIQSMGLHGSMVWAEKELSKVPPANFHKRRMLILTILEASTRIEQDARRARRLARCHRQGLIQAKAWKP
jgi:hypothetical protein